MRSEICCVCDAIRQQSAGIDKFHYDSCLLLQITSLVHTIHPTSCSRKYTDSISLILEGFAQFTYKDLVSMSVLTANRINLLNPLNGKNGF